MYQYRRKKLLETITERHPEISHGAILFFAPFENKKYTFRQESSFYYFTGCKEPGAIFSMDLDGVERIFLPNYGGKREKWVNKVKVEVEVKSMGQPTEGYWLRPGFRKEEHENVIEEIDKIVGKDGTIFTLLDEQHDPYFILRYRFEKLFAHLVAKDENVIDISKIVSLMRRKKDKHELALIQKAVDITCKAHERVAEIVRPGLYEYEVQAEVEKVFTQNNARVAFPSIVASGKNSTVLHYMARDKKLKDGDLVVVDIGAEVDGYCADLTRTFPVSRKFTQRQREIFDLVLAVQEKVVSVARPGMFLRNASEPDRSLQYIAEKFLEERGYKEYFFHGIGHFLGLEVHDVGDLSAPLEEGDVITIEPGIYIPEENLGVRIEDDFVVEGDGTRALSAKLAKILII
jgi:Xaa-Pro aminopeptidase